MKLGLRVLDDVQTVNSLEEATEVSVVSGDPVDLYFQLVDGLRDAASPAYRYMPTAGATLSLILDNLDIAKRVTKVASQPFSDLSIWKVSLTALETAKLKGTVSLLFTLTEGSVSRNGRALAAVLVS